MMDKYQLIDSIAVEIDALIEMRGVEKCRTALDVIGKLNALRGGLAEEDKQHEATVAQLKGKISELLPYDDEDTETIGGRTYKIGQTAEGDQ